MQIPWSNVSPRPSLPAHVIVVRFTHLRWEVSLDGRTRPRLDWLCTRERAVEHALEMARDLVMAPGREMVRVVVDGHPGFERLFFSDAAREAGWGLD